MLLRLDTSALLQLLVGAQESAEEDAEVASAALKTLAECAMQARTRVADGQPSLPDMLLDAGSPEDLVERAKLAARGLG